MFKRASRAGLLPGLFVTVVLIAAFALPVGPGRPGTVLACYSYGVGCGVPTVTGVSPNSGPITGGTTVTITGTEFNNSGVSVSFGGVAATGVTVVSDTQITAVSPAHAAGPVDVSVTTAAGTSATSAADLFTYTPLAAASQYVAVTSVRLLDTRSTGGALGAGRSRGLTGGRGD